MGFAVVGRLSNRQIERRIRSAAEETHNVILTRHAKARLRERRVSISMLYECLRHGTLSRIPEPNALNGTLECRMVRYTCGMNIGVVVAISDDDPHLIVVTVLETA
jgi:hypothetical protein